MYKLLTLSLVFSMFLACKEEKKSTAEKDENSIETQDNYSEDTDDGVEDEYEDTKWEDADEDMPEVETPDKASTNKDKTSTSKNTYEFTGTFKNEDSGNESANCQCDCVELAVHKNMPLCLDLNSKISIQVKYTEVAKNKLDVYYVSGRGSLKGIEKEIPWDKFDQSEPLATIQFSDTDHFKLDWKGFMMDGKIAMDYAVLGKKNLEGNYSKIN